MATNTRKLASLLGASGAGIANAGTLTSAAIGDVIVSGDIADDAVDSEHLAPAIAISTSGNIATTGSGTLSVAGASTLTGASTHTAGLLTNTIGERTSTTGVTIDSLLIKDGSIKIPSAGTGVFRSDGTTAVLAEASSVATLDNVTLGSSVAGLPSSVMVQSKCYLITGPSTAADGVGARTDLLIMAFTKTHDASTSKLMFQGAGRIFDSVGEDRSWSCHMFTKVGTTYTAAPVTTSHGTNPAGVHASVYRLNDGQSTPFRTSDAVTLGPFETTDYANGTYSFVLSHYRDGYDALIVDWFCAQITEVMI